MAILKLDNVVRQYTKGDNVVNALGGVTMSVDEGEFLAVVGPSGSGKSTALNIIGCLDRATSGNILFNDEDLGGLKEKQLAHYRKENIAFIFQSYNLIPVLTVKENVELPMVIEKKYSTKEISERAMDILNAVGLKGMENRRPKELSGGQEQRVAIARALVKNPLVVLADEPTANLDSETAAEVIDLMLEMNKKRHTTFIFSTHDPRMVKHARRIITLKDGLIDSDKLQSGTAS